MSEEVISIPATKYIYVFSPEARPVAEAQSKDVVIFETVDAFNEQIKTPEDTLDEVDFGHINPATGPLYIHGATPGDTLAVEFLSLQVKDQGSLLSVPGLGILADEVPESVTRIADIGEDSIDIGVGIPLPKRPMMGVIGVAPEGEEIPCGTPDRHGGNMDTNLVTTGATLFFPVQVDGALLAMGDAHALMGDGEVCGTGIECSAVATVRVEVLKDRPVSWPWLKNQEQLSVIVSAETLEQASEEAVRQMVHYLMDRHGRTFDQAYMLMSTIGSISISQIVDPKLTVRASIPRRAL